MAFCSSVHCCCDVLLGIQHLVQQCIQPNSICHIGDQHVVLLQTKQSSQRFVSEVEKRWGVQLPPGRNSDLVFMAHLWEPLRQVHPELE